ncbi:MAG: hypothetical protein ABI867_02695 [Kofleriaceae bacterium]
MDRLACALVLIACPAHADNPVMPHVNAGLEVMGGDAAIELASRVHLGASRSFGAGTLRPSLGFGITFAAGYLEDIPYRDVGPELQVGLRVGDGGLVDNRVFAAAAVLQTGMRLSLGASIAGLVKDLHTPHGYLLIVMPQQLELAWTRDDGANRFGAVLSYGI